MSTASGLSLKHQLCVSSGGSRRLPTSRPRTRSAAPNPRVPTQSGLPAQEIVHPLKLRTPATYETRAGPSTALDVTLQSRF